MAEDLNQDYINRNGNGYSNGQYRGEVPLEHNIGNTAEEEIDIRQILALALHHKWLISSIIGVTTIISIVIALMMMPIYQSEGTMIISEAPNRYSMAGNDISNLLMSSYGIGVGSSVDNELEVLNSRQLAWTLANKISDERFDFNGRLYPLLWRSFPKDSSLVGLDTVTVRIMENKVVEQKGGKLSSIIGIKFLSPSPSEAMRMVDLIIDAYSTASTTTNRVQAKAALNFLSRELEHVKSDVINKEEQLREFMNETQLVQLDAQTTQLVNILAQLEAEKKTIDVKLVAVTQGIEKYTQELERIKPGLTQQYTNSVSPIINRLQVQTAEFETERILLLAKNPELKDHPESSARLVQLEKQISFLKEEIQKSANEVLQSGDEQLIGFLGSADGGVASNISKMRSDLLQFEIERTQYESQIKLLNKQMTEYQKVFSDLPDNMIDLARIKRDLLVNEQLYLTLAKQSAEMALWEQTQSGLARIVDSAYLPVIPVKPRKRLIVLFGMIVGAALSFGVVYVRELSKQELDSVEKLRKKGLPILSVIPDMEPYVYQNFDGKESIEVAGQKVSTSLVTLLDSISPISESFRRLQSNIMYSKPDDPYKVLLVTSSNKSEGKSTVSSNLAISMAETGNRVLIIDCDFRRPRLHNIFGAPSSPGLVDLLFEDKNPQDYIHQSLIENVFVLTAGNRPPNPAEINRSRKLKNLISKLRYEYDYVILDTPPYGIITDAAPLIKLADGLVVVVKFNQTKNGELDHTLDSLNRINANIIGTCMTAFDAKKTSGYYYTDYYYQYSYESYKDYDKREA